MTRQETHTLYLQQYVKHIVLLPIFKVDLYLNTSVYSQPPADTTHLEATVHIKIDYANFPPAEYNLPPCMQLTSA